MKNKEKEIDFLEDAAELSMWGQNILEVIDDTNIPYQYLPKHFRENIPEIIQKIILPNLQTRLRSSEKTIIMQEEVQRLKKIYSPEIMSVKKYASEYKDVTNEKILIQKKISEFVSEAIEKQSLDGVVAGKLLAKSDEIEPKYFAITSQAKLFTDYCYENVLSMQAGCLTEEEKWLLYSPSQVACYIQKELDTAEYFAGEGGVTLRLIANRYYNSDLDLAGKYLKNVKRRYQDVVFSNICIAREEQHLQTNRKIYFLLERKIPLASELDSILVMDHCFDKYLESKSCFLHDLFLKILMSESEGRNLGFDMSLGTLSETIIATINRHY